MKIIVGLLALGLALAQAGPGMRFFSDANAAEAFPKEPIAAQIRKQGFACDKPLSLERDRQISKPNETVWVLKCENATYRVRPIPHRAAGVERIN